MQYIPTYRGKKDDLNNELPQAKRWIIDICRRIIAEFDQQVKDEIHAMLNAAMASDSGSLGHSEGFRMQITRSWGSGSYWNRTEHHSDFFFEWNIGQDTKHDYKAQKLVLRKNGTVHEENLAEALRIWACRRISRRRADSIYEANLAEYEQLQSPGKHDNNVTVELSKGKTGMCNITYSNTWVKLGKVYDVPIQNAKRMIEKMMSVAENFAADAVEIHNDI